MKSDYPHLFEPIRLGNTVFRNRIFTAPIAHPHLDSNRHMVEASIRWLERKAMGGCASVNFGSVLADSVRGSIGPHMRLDDPTTLPTLFRFAQAVNTQGAVSGCEVLHAGMNAYLSLAEGNKIYSAFKQCNAAGIEVEEMPEDIILDTIEKHADAALYLKQIGFGMITLHAGHGWLFNQFACPENNRKDQWGGSVENQCRIVVATIDRIHEKCGRGFPVDVRISASSLLDYSYDLDYGIEMCKQLEGHADSINVSVGLHEEPTVIIRTVPSMFMDDGANLKYAAEIKKHVSTPISTVGAFADPQLMEDAIASGSCDIIYCGRGLMADPDLPIKAMTGREDEIRKCIRCFECYSAHCGKGEHVCAINPEQGREGTIDYSAPARREKVLVIGGGVGGMQAAITASKQGHEVILCEKSDRLGGSLRCEEKVPFKQNLQHYLNTQAHILCDKTDVDVRMNTEATPELIAEIAPDVLIAAIGSRAVKPRIPGIDGANVMCADDAFLNAEKVGERVVVLGGGLVGIESAIYLAGLGRKVTIVEMADDLRDGGNFIHSLALSREIRDLGIEVFTCTRADEISEKGVTGTGVGDKFAIPCSPTYKAAIIDMGGFGVVEKQQVPEGESRLFEADTVVYAIGQAPLQDDAMQLASLAPEFHMLGDCLAPKNILAANQSAFSIALNLGKH